VSRAETTRRCQLARLRCSPDTIQDDGVDDLSPQDLDDDARDEAESRAGTDECWEEET
jgi:hypothetical protein